MTLRRYLSKFLRLCEPSASIVQVENEGDGKLTEQSSSEVCFEVRKSLKEVAERIAGEFEFSGEDTRRAVDGFLEQMS
jgi:hypothetical protein